MDAKKIRDLSTEEIIKKIEENKLDDKKHDDGTPSLTKEEAKRLIKEALEIMFKDGHNKLTIGSCCLEEYKEIIGKKAYEEYHPNIYNFPIDISLHGEPTAGDWIRHSYKGGWCYLVRGKENQIKTNGTTADVNSLYPSMMSSESGNRYPVGLPTFWHGNYIPDEALDPSKYYFIRIKTRFYLVFLYVKIFFDF